MTRRTRKYLLRKKRRIVWQNMTNHMVRLSGGPLVCVLENDPVPTDDGEYVYTVKLVDNENR